eukprot:5392-Heterococcus_DN1.PRE.3
MAEDSRIVSALPLPPPYYKLFAPKPEKAQDVVVEKESAASEGAYIDSEATSVSKYPLQPPPLPLPGTTYESFGTTCKVDLELEYLLPKEQILFASGPSVSFKVEMRKLLDSTLANYQQLLDTLTRCPSLADSKPYEAREVLAQHLRAQIADQRGELDNLTAAIAQSQQKYDSAISGLHDAQHSSHDSSSSATQQRAVNSTAAMDTA